MKEDRGILSLKEYGIIKINLKECLEERGWTRNYLARAANTRFEVVNKWCDNRVEKLDLDVLARFCYVLDCPLTEILTYQNHL